MLQGLLHESFGYSLLSKVRSRPFPGELFYRKLAVSEILPCKRRSIEILIHFQQYVLFELRLRLQTITKAETDLSQLFAKSSNLESLQPHQTIHRSSDLDDILKPCPS